VSKVGRAILSLLLAGKRSGLLDKDAVVEADIDVDKEGEDLLDGLGG